MRITSSVIVTLLACGVLSSCGGGPFLNVDLDAQAREYCQRVDYPDGWKYPLRASSGLVYPSSIYDYEVRSGSMGELLIAGAFDEGFAAVDRYTTSKYQIEFSPDGLKALPIDEATWEDALKIPLSRASIVRSGIALQPGDEVMHEGHPLPKTGEFWSIPGAYATRLSPDGAWVVLQSRDRSGRGAAYFDVYNVATGEKLLTIEGSFGTAWPDSFIGKTFWLTEQYFVIPVGDAMQGSIFCDFGPATR